MKKISFFVLSLSLLALSSINNVSSLHESSLDFNNESGITFKRNANNDVTSEEAIYVSNIYVQHGIIDGYDCLRFATAIKGNNGIMFVVKSTASNCFNFDYLKIETKATLLNNPALVVQAEDNVKSGETAPTNRSYTVINDDNKAQTKKDCTFSGAGYIGSISEGGEIDFYIYSDQEINNAKIVLTAASPLLNDTEQKMDDLQLNKCFDISVEDNKIGIANDVVVKGLSYPKNTIEGSKWTRWVDINLGSINIKKGFTKVSILCTGTVKDCTSTDRAPNIDRLSIIL